MGEVALHNGSVYVSIPQAKGTVSEAALLVTPLLLATSFRFWQKILAMVFSWLYL